MNETKDRTEQAGLLISQYRTCCMCSCDRLLPLSFWRAEDVVALINLLDAELQRRHDED